MRRADRLLQIVQILRRAAGPVTARIIAAELEIVPRTVYRDIVALQASGVPIDGEAGVGYVLHPGYDLPPLMFAGDEIAAIVLGLTMVIERGDTDLALGARDALAKVEAVVPASLRSAIDAAQLLVPHRLEPGVGFGEHLPAIRDAIRTRRKLRIRYNAGEDAVTERTIWPLGLYLYSHVTLLGAWCEERNALRAFRTERIAECNRTDDRFNDHKGALWQQFLEGKRKL